ESSAVVGARVVLPGSGIGRRPFAARSSWSWLGATAPTAPPISPPTAALMIATRANVLSSSTKARYMTNPPSSRLTQPPSTPPTAPPNPAATPRRRAGGSGGGDPDQAAEDPAGGCPEPGKDHRDREIERIRAGRVCRARHDGRHRREHGDGSSSAQTAEKNRE